MENIVNTANINIQATKTSESKTSGSHTEAGNSWVSFSDTFTFSNFEKVDGILTLYGSGSGNIQISGCTISGNQVTVSGSFTSYGNVSRANYVHITAFELS